MDFNFLKYLKYNRKIAKKDFRLFETICHDSVNIGSQFFFRGFVPLGYCARRI